MGITREPALRVDEALKRVDEVESRLQALVPEEDRRGRMLRAAAAPEAGRQPLHGAVVGVKDVIHVAGLLTRAGSAVPPEVLAGPQASSVTLLREAGAIVLGKTVTAEFASAAPGPTRNPRRLSHTPGGSSSGSAAAVAAGYCPFALGTQTVGSVIRPAAYCGVVGFKPSYGRIPTDGVVMNAPSFDTVGVLAADVRWALVAASVLCAGWSPAAAAPGRPMLGVPEGPYLEQASTEARSAFARQAERLEAAGYAVLRVPALLDIEAVNRRHVVINRVQFAEQHAERFGRYGDRYRPVTAGAIQAGRSLPRAEYERALEEHPRLREELSAIMVQRGIDLWICPAATGPAPEGIETTGDPRMNLPWTHAGLPVVTVPAGEAAGGLPLGLQVVAGFGADERLLAWAGDLEQAMQAGKDLTEPGP